MRYFSARVCAALTALALGAAPGAHTQTASSTPSAKPSAFAVGDKILAFGLGIGLTYNYIDGASVLPTLVATYDQGVVGGVGPGVIGFGGIFGYKAARYDAGGGYEARWRNLIVGARGTYHLALGEGLEQLDPYGGVMLGLRFSHYSNDYSLGPGIGYELNRARLASGLFAGVRYHITPGFGAWLEAGYDVALLKFGVHVAF